jgi:uracil-DNA glycosylase
MFIEARASRGLYYIHGNKETPLHISKYANGHGEVLRMVRFDNDWDELLRDEFTKDYYLGLREFLKVEYRTQQIFPDMHSIFTALKCSSRQETKVVILGQDPYHGAGQAHGLAFSVLPGVDTPPSLQNIYKELAEDLGCSIPNNGCLLPWAGRECYCSTPA